VNLADVARDLAELPRQAIIYVPRDELVVSKSTLALLVLADEESPEGWRYLLEVLIAREVLEVWSAWRNGRIPSVEEAREAVIYYADNDAYQPDG
jgi:hypothetical protein